MHAARKWSQHWLANDDLARALVRRIEPVAGDRFLEIGAGRGRMTRALLAHAVSVTAIEIDPACCAALRQLAEQEHEGRLQIIEADVLAVDPRRLGAPLRLVGNLPYAVSSPILRWTLQHRDLVADAHYMLQAEVAERVTATPSTPQRGLLSVLVQWDFEADIVRRLGPGAFRPAPRVDSAFLHLRPRPAPPLACGRQHRDRVLGAAFAHRRKTLANNLRHAGWERGDVDAALHEAGIDPAVRAEALDLAELARLADALPERTA